MIAQFLESQALCALVNFYVMQLLSGQSPTFVGGLKVLNATESLVQAVRHVPADEFNKLLEDVASPIFGIDFPLSLAIYGCGAKALFPPISSHLTQAAQCYLQPLIVGMQLHQLYRDIKAKKLSGNLSLILSNKIIAAHLRI